MEKKFQQKKIEKKHEKTNQSCRSLFYHNFTERSNKIKYEEK